MAKRRAPTRPADQLELESAPVEEAPPARAKPSKPLPAGQVETMAKRAVARRGVDETGHVKIAVTISRPTAEALSARAIRESRNFEDVAAEILETEAGAD